MTPKGVLNKSSEGLVKCLEVYVILMVLGGCGQAVFTANNGSHKGRLDLINRGSMSYLRRDSLNTAREKACFY
jgi:hypothetical protein